MSLKMRSYATTHHPSSTEQTTRVHQEGSHPAGASGKGRSSLEASPLDCSAGDASQVASSGLSPFLEAEVKDNVNTSEGSSRDHRVDQGDGQEQSTLGSRTDSWRIAQAGILRWQTNGPKVHAACVSASIKGTELENLSPQLCRRNVGLRCAPLRRL